MSRIAFLFPGQGSQFVGMAQDLHEALPEARELFERANDALGFDLKRLCFDGPEETLRRTQYTQPAIFTHSMIMDRVLKSRGIHPAACAGHSLGEYSALVSAGVLRFEEALGLVKIRGELMQHAGEINPGTMAAVMGLDADAIDAVCSEAAEAGIVKPANYNCPGQIVISGAVPAVHRAMEIAKERGARMVKELTVSGAFHSPLMDHAYEPLDKALDKVSFQPATETFYSNVEAVPVVEPEAIRRLLHKQLMEPVRWEAILTHMLEDGCDLFYEVGPGKVLCGLLKRTRRETECLPAGTMADLEALAG